MISSSLLNLSSVEPGYFLSNQTTTETGLSVPTATTEYDELDLSWKTHVDTVLLILNALASILNLFVIVTSVRLFRITGDVVHLFVCSMTCADLLITLFGSPMEIWGNRHGFTVQDSAEACVFKSFMNWYGIAMSAISLSLLNVDKLIFFKMPFKYEQLMSPCRTLIIIASAWGVTLLFNIVIFNLSTVTTQEDVCGVHDIAASLYWIYFTFYCFVCVLSSGGLSTYLFILTNRLRRATPAISEGGSSGTNSGGKSLVFIFITAAWTCISLLPYRTFLILRITVFSNGKLDGDLVALNVSWFLWYLLMLNSIGNPLITVTIYAPYRSQLCKAFRNVTVCCKSVQNRRLGSLRCQPPLVSARNGREHTSVELKDTSAQKKNGVNHTVEINPTTDLLSEDSTTMSRINDSSNRTVCVV